MIFVYTLLVVAALYLLGWQFDRLYYVRKIRPTKLHITDLTDGKLITYRWLHSRHYWSAFALLAYLGFLTWIIISVTSRFDWSTDLYRARFAMLIIVSFVVLMAYDVLVGFYNQTVIVVFKTGNLKVYHRPFPAFRDRARNIGSVRNVTYRKENFFAGWGSFFSVFPIYIHTKDGKRIRIIREVDTEQAAIDIQAALRDVLNIADDQPKILQARQI